MHSNNIRELFTALQYLLIGVIAESCVILWFSQRPSGQQLAIWTGIAAALSVLRFVVLAFTDWTRKNDWQNVSRRNW
ncbi:MAG: hypothetical protein ACKVZH_13195 [Blastocatellia bacterium]